MHRYTSTQPSARNRRWHVSSYLICMCFVCAQPPSQGSSAGFMSPGKPRAPQVDDLGFDVDDDGGKSAELSMFEKQVRGNGAHRVSRHAFM